MQEDHLLLEFRLSNLARGLSPRTIEYYDDNLSIFFDHIEEESINQITRTTIRQFLASKRDSVSPSTLHIYYRVLKRFFNFLKEEEYLTNSPMDKVQPPKVPKLQPRFLTKEEVKRFFAAINTKDGVGLRNYSFFLFLLDTGARLSEALNLRMDNLDLENGRAFIKGKGAKERYIFFGHRCSRFLAKYIFHYKPDPLTDDLVFLSSSGRRLDPHNVNHICRRIAKRADLKKVHPHCFRHTFATHFLANGGSELVLQRLLGHSSLEMVSRYSHLATGDLARQHRIHSPGDSLFG